MLVLTEKITVSCLVLMLQVELESWDAWMSDDKLSATHTASRYGNRFLGKRPSESELETEVDYFQEMQLEPSISKTKKVSHVITVSVTSDLNTSSQLHFVS